MTERGRRYAKLLGLGLSTGAVVVFISVFAEALSESDIGGLATRHWRAVLFATLVYCFAYAPMTFAWILLARASGAPASPLALARVLLISQIGKYVPGNIAQFLGRAYFARSYGIPYVSTGLAIALELAGILAASGILAAAATALELAGPRPEMAESVAWLSGIAGATALLGSAWILRSKGRKAISLLNPLLSAICLYILVLALLTVANLILVTEISGNWSPGIAGKVAGAFVVSWLIGFATPGSPAGLGIRELTFFALLAGSISEETLLITAAAFRLATIIGDALAWLTGLFLPAPKVDLAPPEPIPL